jgi:hypothetical protein
MKGNIINILLLQKNKNEYRKNLKNYFFYLLQKEMYEDMQVYKGSKIRPELSYLVPFDSHEI